MSAGGENEVWRFVFFSKIGGLTADFIMLVGITRWAGKHDNGRGKG